MRVRARAPLRLGLAGGGTDVSPYCDLYGGAVLNATIDKFAYASVEASDDGCLHFEATDLRQTARHTPSPQLALDGPLPLHAGVYNRVIKDFNDGRPLPLRMSTFSDAPPGSGLGSSSTLVVAMTRAFLEWLNIPIGDYDLAKLAWDIERREVGLAGGRQDHYAAAFGGFNFMEFNPGERVLVNPLRIKENVLSELEASLLLYFGGVSRESAAIIDEQSGHVQRGEVAALAASHALKTEALSMKESLLTANLECFVDSMRVGWEAKKRIASNISNPAIEDAYRCAEAAGMRAGKVSGAGGGGFMMMFVEPNRRMEVVRALGELPGEVMGCHFTKRGAQGWRLP